MWVVIGLDNNMSPVIILANDGISSITLQRTNLHEMFSKTDQFLLPKLHINLSFPHYCPGGDELIFSRAKSMMKIYQWFSTVYANFHKTKWTSDIIASIRVTLQLSVRYYEELIKLQTLKPLTSPQFVHQL